MSVIGTYKIEYVSTKHCFISMPNSAAEKNTLAKYCESNVYEIESPISSSRIYASCSSFHSEGDLIVRMNNVYGQLMNIKNGELVTVRKRDSKVPPANRVHVVPKCEDDLEIIELNCNKIQNELLNQLSIVWPGLVFPFWVHDAICVHLEVCKVIPGDSVAKLKQRSNVLIDLNAPKKDVTNSILKSQRSLERRNSHHEKSNSETFETPSVKNISLPEIISGYDQRININYTRLNGLDQISRGIWKVLRSYVSPVSSPVNETKDIVTKAVKLKSVNIDLEFDKTPKEKFDLVLRVITIHPQLKSKPSARSKCFNYVYVSADLLERYFEKSDSLSFVAELTKFVPRNVDDEGSKTLSAYDGKVEPVAIVRVMAADPSLISLKNYVMCSSALSRQLGISVTSLVQISPVKTKPVVISKLIVYPISTLNMEESAVVAAFKASIIETNISDQPHLFSSGCIFQLRINDDEKRYNFICDVKSESTNKPLYNYASQDYEFDIKVMHNIPLHLKLPNKFNQSEGPPGLGLMALGGIEDLKNQCLEYLKMILSIGHLASCLNDSEASHCIDTRLHGGLLITGSEGCGKTALGLALLREFYESENCVFFEIMECKQMQGKRTDVIKSIWEKMFLNALEHQPSILFFDDLDALIPAPSNEQQLRGEENAFVKIAEIFVEVMSSQIHPESRIAIIASSVCSASLNSILTLSKNVFFKEIAEILPLDQSKRMEVIESLISVKTKINEHETLHALDLDWLSKRMEGFIAEDIKVVIERTIHASSVRLKAYDQLVLTNLDFEKSLEGFMPLSLSSMKLSPTGLKNWNDIGGLPDVKTSLTKMLLWPTKYPKLFAKCPLRLRSGMLLYGPPGTGKTMIAGAAANECKMNFRSIKGPELLSKYIGASEQAVRDLFKSAQAAKPCLLFFDEFDAIAPRRGHDSTGVTDRVVNQFLTQMDGVETLEGVYILAATSRPDLIDPALLRPGRIDKYLYCPLPNKEERLEILEVLSVKVSLDDDVDLRHAAEATEYFSGADLQSLLGTALVNSIHEQTFNKSIEVPNQQSAKEIIFIENSLKGVKQLQNEEKTSIIKEVELLMSKYSLSSLSNQNELLSHERDEHPIITQENIMEALKSSKPSVSESERFKYDMIYETFMKKRTQNATPDASAKKITLA